MKKITAFAVLIMVISTAAFAASGPLGENAKFKVLTKSDTKYELIYVSAAQSDVRVSIIDEAGRTIETSFVKDAMKFRQIFDFSQLAAGKYSLVVKNNEGSAREAIDHLPYKETLQGFVVKIPNKKALRLHVGDFNKSEPVKVNIYDANDRVIHKDEINHNQAFSKVYNMSKASAGEYRVVIANDGESKSFIHKID
jgi:hypothetical protein